MSPVAWSPAHSCGPALVRHTGHKPDCGFFAHSSCAWPSGCGSRLQSLASGCCVVSFQHPVAVLQPCGCPYRSNTTESHSRPAPASSAFSGRFRKEVNSEEPP